MISISSIIYRQFRTTIRELIRGQRRIIRSAFLHWIQQEPFCWNICIWKVKFFNHVSVNRYGNVVEFFVKCVWSIRHIEVYCFPSSNNRSKSYGARISAAIPRIIKTDRSRIIDHIFLPWQGDRLKIKIWWVCELNRIATYCRNYLR